jgi:hypothetical protein
MHEQKPEMNIGSSTFLCGAGLESGGPGNGTDGGEGNYFILRGTGGGI